MAFATSMSRTRNIPDRKHTMKKQPVSKVVLLAQLKAIEENEAKTSDIINDTLPKARLSLLGCLITLNVCGVDDGDYNKQLMLLLKAHEGQAIPLALLRQVLPDAEKLNKAREVLLEAKCIEETKDKASLLIKFVKDFVAAPASVI